MPEIVKYERIQTAETDVHAAQPEDDVDDHSSQSSPHARSAALNRHNNGNSTHSNNLQTQIEMPTARFRYNVAQTTAATVALILLYFCLSIGLTFYQRWLLKDFKFPLFVVICHLVIKLLISVLIRIGYRLVTGRSRIMVDWRTFVQKVSPTGLTSGIDIGFSNWGLELVTISLYTMTKSTTIIFILIFAIVLGLERRSWSLMIIVVMISVGLCLFTYKATEFNGLGFSFLLFASLVSGMRWSFAQLIMQKCKLGLHNPIDMVFHMQPWMILSLLPFTLGFEGRQLYDSWQQLDWSVPATGEMVVAITVKVIGGACIAFCMELSEFLVLSFTSSLTLAVSGIFKEICQLVLAVEMVGDRLSAMNVVGLLMCMGGICSHVLHKYRTMLSSGGIGGGAGHSGSDDGLVNGVCGVGSGGRGHGDGDDGSQLRGGGGGGGAATADDKTAELKAAGGSFGWRSISGGAGKQSVPLLNGGLDDSDDDDEDDASGAGGRQNSSDIIFDVLKRRDSRRAPLQ